VLIEIQVEVSRRYDLLCLYLKLHVSLVAPRQKSANETGKCDEMRSEANDEIRVLAQSAGTGKDR
jgi:hypothetical protein